MDTWDDDSADEVTEGELGLESSEVPEGFTEVGNEAEDTGGDLPGSDTGDDDMDALTDAQIDTAVSELESMPELQPETWEAMDMDARLAALQEVENRMAEIQEREATEIGVEAMEPGVVGGYRRGDGMAISEEHLASDDIAEILDTVTHEGRHAYQWGLDNADEPGSVTTPESWHDNLEDGGYIDPNDDPEGYRNQPIEADAWNYAGRIRSALYGG